MKSQLISKGHYEQHTINDNGKILKVHLQLIEVSNGSEALERKASITEDTKDEASGTSSICVSHEALAAIYELSEKLAQKTLGIPPPDPKGSQR
jgi:hypothetical protein